MLGRAFVGKILFRARDADATPSGLSIGGLDVILAGHLAQAAPIGDDPVYKPGAYRGKGLNKPPDNYSGPEPKTVTDFVNDARLFPQEFDDVALLLNTHRVDEEGDASAVEVAAQRSALVSTRVAAQRSASSMLIPYSQVHLYLVAGES